MTKKTITVIGSSNVDLIIKAKQIPRPGETLTGGTFFQVFGGKGANQAVSAARSCNRDTEVNFVTCLGNDNYADKILESFRNDGINTQFVTKIDGISTGTALITIDENAKNAISVAPGANYSMQKKHIDMAIDVMKSSDYIVLQMEIPLAITEYIIDLASQLGSKVMLNLAPAFIIDDVILKKLNILIVNETEASALTGLKVENESEIINAANLLRSKGVQTVIITLGEKGSFVSAENTCDFIPAFSVKAIDTTAAGDTFCGALAVALSEGQQIQEALRFASAASAISVTRMGAQPSIPSRVEIENFLKN